MSEQTVAPLVSSTSTPWQHRSTPRLPVPAVRDIGSAAWVVSRVGGALMGGGRIRVVDTFARNRRLFWGYLRFAFRLVPLAKLGRRDVEIATLRTAWNAGANYEWAHHVVFSQLAGLSTDDIERIAQGPDAGWSPRDRALLQAVDELHRDRMISEETFDALAEFLDEAQLVELCFLVGHYEMIAMCIKTFGVTVEDNAYERGLLRLLTPRREVAPPV